MVKAGDYRELVEARAGGACEYCQLIQIATGVTFHIEHHIPESQGGKTELSNLVLSCPGCRVRTSNPFSGFRLSRGDNVIPFFP